MRNTTNLGLALYDASDKMNITGTQNSLNHNTELIDAELAKKMTAPETGAAGQILTKTQSGFAWQDAPAGSGDGGTGSAVLYTAQTLTSEQQNQARTNIAAADAEALDVLDIEVNGRVIENTFTEVYSCTAGKAISNVRFLSDVCIPADTEYSFAIEGLTA